MDWKACSAESKVMKRMVKIYCDYCETSEHDSDYCPMVVEPFSDTLDETEEWYILNHIEQCWECRQPLPDHALSGQLCRLCCKKNFICFDCGKEIYADEPNDCCSCNMGDVSEGSV
jgi:hypothetical protein